MHRCDIRVRFAELDPYDHVNHAAYVTYLEVGRSEALEAMGCALSELKQLGWQLVVADLQVAFKRPAVGGDRLVVETWISEMGAVTSRWCQRILRGDEVLVSSEVRAGSTDLSGRPKRLPQELRDRLLRLMVVSSG